MIGACTHCTSVLTYKSCNGDFKGEILPFKTELEITPNNLHVTFSLLFISYTHV